MLPALLAAATLFAAPAGTLAGRIKDPSGALVRGAAITAVRSENGARRTTVSTGDGSFVLPLLEPGEWTVEVEAPGFERAIARPTRVEVDRVAVIEVTLQLAGVYKTAEVRDEPRPLVGETVARTRLAALPLNGRQYLDLALLAPGVVPAPAGTQGLGFNLAGSRSQSNVHLLDGGSNQDTQNNGALNGFRLTEAVEEFNVQTSPAPPEFGRGSGAQVNVVTRSGGNQFHGAAFEYLRNSSVAAADFFTNKLGGSKGSLNRNQFGAAAGGPVARDRTFFFASWEEFRQVSHVISSTRVPTLAERASVTDPISLRLLPYWPLPNASGTVNYNSDVPNRDFDRTLLARIDHRVGQRDQLSGRWIEYRGDSAVAGPTPITGGNNGEPKQRSAMLRDTHVFSPSWINEVSAGFSSNLQEREVQDYDVDLASVIDVPGAPKGAHGLPSITISGGYAALGSNQNFPQGRYTTTTEFSDTAAWRSMRFGIQVRHETLRQYLDRSSRGSITFPAFTNFARGQINSATFRTGSTLAHWGRTPVALYWQHQVRPRPNLSIDFGARYETGSNSAERDGRAANFVEGAGPVFAGTSRMLTVDPLAVGMAALKTVDAPIGLPRAGVFPDRNNFAPMIGLAWSPLDLVVRAGFRLGYDEGVGNLLTSMALAPPFSLQTSQTANVTQPGAFGWALAYNQNVPLISNYGRQGPGTPTVGVITFQGIDAHLRSPYVAHYTVGVQKALGSLVLDAAYQGSFGRRLGIYVDVNQPFVIARDPSRRGTLAPNEQLFPDPRWGQAQILKSIGNSNYNGAVVTLRSAPRKARFFQVSWTAGKSLDYNSSYFGTGNLPGETGTPPDSRNLSIEHGPSSFDVRHRVAGLYGVAFRGWEMYGVATAQSGMPFTVVSGNPDSNGFNQSTAGVSPNGGNRPDTVRAGALPVNYDDPDAAFDTSWFSPALAGRVGTSGRNQYRGPGLVNLDVAVSRQIRLTERFSLRARADFFNVANHTNFANPVADMSNASFGRITQTLGSAVSNAVGTNGGAAGAPRVIQFSLRLQF